MCYCANHKNEFLEVSTIESVASQPGTLRFLFNASDKQIQLPALNRAQAESRRFAFTVADRFTSLDLGEDTDAGGVTFSVSTGLSFYKGKYRKFWIKIYRLIMDPIGTLCLQGDSVMKMLQGDREIPGQARDDKEIPARWPG